MLLRYLGEEELIGEEVVGSQKDYIYDCTVITSKNTVRVHAPKDLHIYSSFADMLKEWEEVG